MRNLIGKEVGKRFLLMYVETPYPRGINKARLFDESHLITKMAAPSSHFTNIDRSRAIFA